MYHILAGALILALAFPATAGSCTPGASSADIDTTNAAGRQFYVVDDCYASWCTAFGATGITVTGALYMYEETNGREGLQRSDEIRDDTCNGMVPSDKIVFADIN